MSICILAFVLIFGQPPAATPPDPVAQASAHLDAGTQNGGIQIGIPVTVQGQIGRTLETDLGRGGPTLRLRTTNGGLSINRRQ